MARAVSFWKHPLLEGYSPVTDRELTFPSCRFPDLCRILWSCRAVPIGHGVPSPCTLVAESVANLHYAAAAACASTSNYRKGLQCERIFRFFS